MEEINSRLEKVKEDLRLHRKWSDQQSSLEKEINEVQGKLDKLKRELQKENRDVDKLEEWTLTGLLLAMTGKKEERLQKEKEEAVKAKLRVDEWKQTLEELLQEDQEVSSKLTELGSPQSRYELLLETKEQMIHDSSSPLSQLLFNLAEQSAEFKTQLKEVKEAEDAAAMALLKLDSAAASLESAGNWGMVDMVGGGIISSAAKRSKMDEAQRSLHEAQRYLKKLEKELADLNMESTQTLETSGFLNMTDLFFDNFFSDMMVQDKISRTVAGVGETRRELRSLSAKLGQNANKLAEEIEETEEKKKINLENA
ncbi:hypothetical protein FZC78_15010 [Rossellomorea vietnamensis]|uniref:Uncharacterized protein n=1 Tax=Rossellomorea vietnamensis TaxID=218284 RepID=A0A5D4NPR5_9BACI|nr:hypothetical protein [Rossellomorea vietnamensis]TYS15890.1 hypothetical protein FZC78_15010 [Rossellomorea vietnamensis]